MGSAIGSELGAIVGADGSEPAIALHRDVKALFDPKGLLNPGKKEP